MSEMSARLRLGLAPGGLSRARRHPLLKAAGKAPGRGGDATLHLLDTRAGRFAAAGWLCLASDETAGRRHETIAISGQAATAAPSLDADTLIALASGTRRSQSRRLDVPGATDQTLSLCFNSVSLQAGRKTTAFDELELQGETTAMLHDLALRLGADLPLVWTGAAPLVRAAAELGLVEPPALRAGALSFDVAEDADAMQAFAAIARHCLAQFDANLLPVLRNADSEGVHQMRVALRRLRSALGVFAPLLDQAALAPLLDDLRWLNAPLGRKRDLDVFIAETLQPLRGALADTAGLRHLGMVLEERREAAQTALDSALLSPRLAMLRLGLEHYIEAALLDRAGAPPARHFAAEVLRKRRKKTRRLGDDHASLDVPALHVLRIRAKKLRYAAEFFRPLFGRKDTRRFIVALAELQDCLGALNDADVGSHLVRDVIGLPDRDEVAAAIAAWFAGRQQLQIARLGSAWQAFAAIKPFWKDALDD